MNVKAPKSLFFLWLILFVYVWPAPTARGQHSFEDLKPTLILISIDGFRADYQTKYPHPTLDSLANDGVRARWMTPSFPSLTFPNHYAIATGLYPEHNGIVANEIYDPVFDALFSMSKRAEVRNGRWWGGEPIWITAEKQGQKASAVFWPGSEAAIRGTMASYWKPFDDKVTTTDRVDTLLSLLDVPANRRPTFLTLYFSDVDHAGHDFSPDSPEVAKAIAVVDSALDRLVSGLRTRNIYAKVNIMVVSDHGMAPLPAANRIILDDYFDSTKARQIVWGGEMANVFPRQGQEAALFRSIKRNQLRHAHCYRKPEIPARFHYRASRRIGPIVCMADEGWRIQSRARYLADQLKPDQKTSVRGAHGYDNQLRSMRAIFIARGPAFRHGATVEPFANVDVYNIMARVLGLTPAQNDGNAATVRAVLR